MTRPSLLDLCCLAGGAGRGYSLAGFEVVGVDLIRPAVYGGDEFHRGGALPVLRHLLRYGHVLGRRFDAIHVSPPCQIHSALTKGNARRAKKIGRSDHRDLIGETRMLLDRIGLPYVIENVAGAPVRKDLVLCGEMFSLGVIRHRFFELGGWSTAQPEHVAHRGRVRGWRHGEFFDGPYVAPYGDGGGKGSVAEWQRAMGIDWTDEKLALAEAIPPAYTEYIGRELLLALL